jgi:hypothetical protein
LRSVPSWFSGTKTGATPRKSSLLRGFNSRLYCIGTPKTYLNPSVGTKPKIQELLQVYRLVPEDFATPSNNHVHFYTLDFDKFNHLGLWRMGYELLLIS